LAEAAKGPVGDAGHGRQGQRPLDGQLSQSDWLQQRLRQPSHPQEEHRWRGLLYPRHADRSMSPAQTRGSMTAAVHPMTTAFTSATLTAGKRSTARAQFRASMTTSTARATGMTAGRDAGGLGSTPAPTQVAAISSFATRPSRKPPGDGPPATARFSRPSGPAYSQ